MSSSISLALSQTRKRANEALTTMIHAFEIKPLFMPLLLFCKYQNEVAELWRTALSRYLLLFPVAASKGENGSLSAEEERLPDMAKPDAPEAKDEKGTSDNPDKAIEPPSPIANKDKEKRITFEAPPMHKLSMRQPGEFPESSKRANRTAQSVLAGFKHRSFSIKSIHLQKPELRKTAKTVLHQGRKEADNRRPSVTPKHSTAKSKVHRKRAR